MPDSKQLRWVDDYSRDCDPHHDGSDKSVSSTEPAANDSDGWEQYRQWISKAPAPRGRRAGIDPTLYTWKGYRNWSEQVRRNWEADSSDDSE